MPPLTAETRFPLGTFRVWTVWRPAAQVLVYPAPEPLPAAPAARRAARRRRRDGAACRAAGEFDGVRAYRRGDPLKLVVWKKAAKADELVSRDTQQAQRHELWLDFAQAPAAWTLERKLSRLAAWVLQADRLGAGLRAARCPERDQARAAAKRTSGDCLEALAAMLTRARRPAPRQPATRCSCCW